MKNSLSNWSFLDSASRWIRNTLAKHADEAALQDRGEQQRIASDLNLSVAELHALCAKDGGSVNLLQKRMSQLHLDKSEIKRAHPAVVRDLEKVCALCDSDAKCSRDFKQNADPKGWTEYCPNASTLEELQHEPAIKTVA
jgi:hypothetical protein